MILKKIKTFQPAARRNFLNFSHFCQIHFFISFPLFFLFFIQQIANVKLKHNDWIVINSAKEIMVSRKKNMELKMNKELLKFTFECIEEGELKWNLMKKIYISICGWINNWKFVESALLETKFLTGWFVLSSAWESLCFVYTNKWNPVRFSII